jgi:uncharacterized protein (DUF427 family)
VRTYFAGKLIADSEHVLLVYETKRPPAYWFPIADVRMEYLEASHQAADTIRWHLVVKDRIAQNAARAYLKPTDDRAALEGHLTFFWDKMNAWFEEDEQVFVHPGDPYTRVHWSARVGDKLVKDIVWRSMRTSSFEARHRAKHTWPVIIGFTAGAGLGAACFAGRRPKVPGPARRASPVRTCYSEQLPVTGVHQ